MSQETHDISLHLRHVEHLVNGGRQRSGLMVIKLTVVGVQLVSNSHHGDAEKLVSCCSSHSVFCSACYLDMESARGGGAAGR